jgi:tocopherol cyclase
MASWREQWRQHTIQPTTHYLTFPMDHFAPHKGVTFEGYYSKFRLPSGASIALIISTVPAAAKDVSPSQALKRMAYMISFTYVHPDSRHWFQREYYPSTLETTSNGHKEGEGFLIKWESGEFGWDGKKELVWWKLDTDQIGFSASTSAGSRIPWKDGDRSSTPAGILARLPLPIQWHVHALDSDCEFTLSLPDEADLLPLDTQSVAKVHIEKNWALSFPESYIWIQARHHDQSNPKGICIAGGSLIKGVQAYLLGYENGPHSLTFTPPSSTSIFSLSLGLNSDISYIDRKIVIDIKGWFKRIRVKATAPEGTFFTLSAPLATGHAPDYATQSFAATIEVETWTRSWPLPWSTWVKASGETFERGSLEFGGGFYKAHTE